MSLQNKSFGKKALPAHRLKVSMYFCMHEGCKTNLESVLHSAACLNCEHAKLMSSLPASHQEESFVPERAQAAESSSSSQKTPQKAPSSKKKERYSMSPQPGELEDDAEDLCVGQRSDGTQCRKVRGSCHLVSWRLGMSYLFVPSTIWFHSP